MKRYGYFQAIVMSFYSADLYRDVARNWGGRVLAYLLLVLTLCCLADVIALQIYINRNYDAVAERHLDGIVKQIPEITLKKDGTIETPENRPYSIQNPKNNDVIAVIDTSGHYTTLENQPFDILFTKTKFFLRNNDGTVEIRPLPSNLNYHFQAESVRPKIKAFLTTWVGIILFPFILVFAFFGRLIQSLFYALIGKILSYVGKNELNYFTIVSIAVVALTPAIITGTILEIIGSGFRGQGLLMFFVTIAYLYYGIQANKFISRNET